METSAPSAKQLGCPLERIDQKGIDMDARILGSSGIKVAPIGMGCMGITHASGDPMPDADAVEVIRDAYEMGYTLFDTAECYVGVRPDGTIAHNEDVVGQALQPIRDNVVIATKFGVRHGADKVIHTDSRPETIRASIDGSLRRLRTDCIDLYYQHRIDPKVQLEEVAQVMQELIDAGKIRAWGISEATEEYLRRAHAVCPVAAIQNRYSMMARWNEKLFPVCEELDVAFVAFSPMANGFLTGAYGPNTKFEGAQDYRAGMPQYTEEGEKRAEPLMSMVRTLAAKHDATPAQISLAWMLAKEPFIIPIPGSRKPKRLKENFEASKVHLPKGEVAELDRLLDGLDLEVFGGHAVK